MNPSNVSSDVKKYQSGPFIHKWLPRRPHFFFILSWLFPLLLFFVWEYASRAGWIAAELLPAPSKVLSTAIDLIQSGALQRDLLVSLSRAVAGWSIGASIGFLLGLTVGFSALAGALLDRTIQMMRAIPFLAMLPLVIVWVGVGEEQKIFMVALGVTFPVYINTTLGIRQLDPRLLELARVQKLGHFETIRRIVFPAALPSILTGVRYSLATAWLALVIAETVGASSGIGFLAVDAREFLQTDIIVLTIVIYAVIGMSADAIARALERHLLAWHPNYAPGARR
ncbi:ABC transporter permease subunit [Affinibrenneria salicis]|uniref:ABC transporter permease subunit n=1 Tax=Affinibrenneria salicis TaxID=2590031 RepID=A0A5J5G370_9GAMM|nr:ABC transporter permease subunit [Affinibrenneria salicis]